jgi:hypothetical protein
MCFGGILGFIDLLCVASGFLSPIFSSLLPFSLSRLLLAQVRGKRKKESKKESKEERKKIILRAER